MAQLLSRKAPSLFWTLAEGRSVVELNWFYALRLLMKRLPKGDGHPVIFFPGFVASDFSTRPMRGLLKDLGYSTYGWGLGRNLVFNEKREDQMRDLLKSVYEKEGRKVSLVGWSLGGVFVREIAKVNPEYVRSVITLGSPISGDLDHSNARRIYTAINGKADDKMEERLKKLRIPPPVPTTSIYTKTRNCGLERVFTRRRANFGKRASSRKPCRTGGQSIGHVCSRRSPRSTRR